MSSLFHVSPEAAGLSPARLARIGEKMSRHIENGRIAGGLGLILRQGQVGYCETWGMADREAGKPMRLDTIFRIYSMTKAITGVAAMMLFEEGAFALADPIANFIPEFREMQVAVEADDLATGKPLLTGTVPAERPITMLDIMRHTAGFNYTGPHDEKGEMLYPQRGLVMLGCPLNSGQFVKQLAGAPLVRQPGTAWDYGFGTDVLGRIVEIISGHTLAEFFQRRIFEPLRMVDTGFHVPEEKWGRLAAIYQPSQGPSSPITRMKGVVQDGFLQPPVMCAGGGGLTSTLSDYLRFTRMLLNEGELDGERLLSPLTVELMRSDLLGDLPAIGPLLAAGHGFGLTFAVSKGPGRTATLPSAGQYRWGGAAGTAFWIDPKQDMIGIFMIQTLLDLVKRNEFMQLAYQAVVD
jgi:CubicO group peptidase (beta-lactamase class C family)